MYNLILSVMVLIIVGTPPVQGSGRDEEMWRDFGLLVVGEYADYQEAVRAAKQFSGKSNMEYSDRNHVFDEQRGLILPDDYTVNGSVYMYAGKYVGRRKDWCDYVTRESCVTVELSAEYYLADEPYIVLAGILHPSDIDARLRAAKQIVPTARIHLTSMFMGGMH